MKTIKHILVLTVLSFVNAGVSYACSCIGPADAQKGLVKAGAVFSGRVVKSDEYTAEVELERYWKGTFAKNRITVINPAPNSSCSMALDQGERYVVFASVEGEGGELKFIPQICNYTSVLSKAQQTLKEIGNGKPFRKRRAKATR